ncbi:MAG: sulfatase-like hydrolase/transferase [Alloprevotella sp.]|nr:sulfatase-like hydrolase/transferase [Alloprevotella sp.]
MQPHQLLLPCLGLAAGAFAQTAQRPNVILLVADDLGYGDLSCYGATRVQTPAVDSIARHGVRFTDCHAVASTSTPSRYSLLTGEYCFRRPGTDIAAGNAGLIIRPEQYTIADMFRSVGYTTAAIGKWHLGLGSVTAQQDWNAKLDCTPADIGFDYHYLMAATADRVPCVFIENGSIANYDASAPVYVSYVSNFEGEPTGANNPELLTKLKSSHGHNQSIVNGIGRIGYMKGGGKALWRDEDIADSIIAHSVSFMADNKEHPFFMYLCTNDVHVPRYPHERFRGKSPMGLRGEAILQFDYTVGRIAAALDSLGIADNTLLIITSDNGPVLDDGYQDQAVTLAGSHKPGGPWRGGKYSAFEAGTAVPFIVNWPARIKEGKTSEALVSHIDDIASLAALVGAELPLDGAYDSQNHLSTWLGEDDADREFVAEMSQARTLSLRTKDWKYIEPCNYGAVQSQTNIETGYLSTPQLYDISASRYEGTNLYSSHREQAEMLSARLEVLRQPLCSSDTTFWYQLYTPGRDNRYLTNKGSGLVGETTPQAERSQWKFVLRADGSYDLVNRYDGTYLVTGAVQKPALQLKTAATPPATGWNLLTDGIMGCLFAVVNGTSQVNQGAASRNWMVLNWGDGTNTTDAGCRYAVVLSDAEAKVQDGISYPELTKNDISARQDRFVLRDTGETVMLYNISGVRQTPATCPMRGLFVAVVGDRTYKVLL